MKKYVLLFASTFLITAIWSQSCIVRIDSLKGKYSGGCKQGRAEGFGTAIGTDTYSGNFKKGLPDGEGKYNGKMEHGTMETGKRDCLTAMDV